MRRLLVLAAIAFGSCLCRAEAPDDSASTLPVTGNLAMDLFGMRTLSGGPPQSILRPEAGAVPDRKSVVLGAGLSLVLPGAGEFYAESYLKAALFLAVEVAAWGLAYYNDKRGNRATDDFNRFADTHWSVQRYVQYTVNNLLPAGAQYNIWRTGAPPPAGAANPWDYVNWDELNRMERDVAATPSGQFYSHTLPVHGDQQYYEEIGKYEQFNSGWDDVSPSLPPDYATIKANESANGYNYTLQRADANAYYKHASTFVAIALVNHLASTIDAALTVGAYNRLLHAEMGVQTVPFQGTYVSVPVLRLSYRL